MCGGPGVSQVILSTTQSIRVAVFRADGSRRKIPRLNVPSALRPPLALTPMTTFLSRLSTGLPATIRAFAYLPYLVIPYFSLPTSFLYNMR